MGRWVWCLKGRRDIGRGRGGLKVERERDR